MALFAFKISTLTKIVISIKVLGNIRKPMEEWKAYQENLKRNVNTISVSKNLEFATEICQRLLPEYINFEKNHNLRNSKLVATGIKVCSNSIFASTDQERVKNLIEKLNLIVSDTEEINDISVSLALNSVYATIETLKYIIDFDSKHIFRIGNYMYDTLNFKIAENPKNSSKQILRDEIKWQLEKTKNEHKDKPVWTVVANIVNERTFGPNGAEIKIGTKHFKPGTKVYIIDWHSGAREWIIVVGMARKSRKFIRITIRVNWVENLRVKLAYNPAVIEEIHEYMGAEQTFLTEEFTNKMCETIPKWQKEMNKNNVT